MTDHIRCEDLEAITQYLDEHAQDSPVLAEIIQRIHVATGNRFVESETLPLPIVADLLLGVWQTKSCDHWNELGRIGKLVNACQAAIDKKPAERHAEEAAG
jgi:hypothetical protein